MSATKKIIQTPLTSEVVQSLRIGDEVLINGVIYAARDAAHKRLVGLIEKGEKLPIDLAGGVIYFVGPTPEKPGQVIGSAGPTTSGRMDAYSPILIEKVGLRGMIGKGNRNKAVIEAMKKFGAVYLASVGGAGALISKSIKKSEIVMYEDLGPEAIRRLEVENFPAVVAIDCLGNDLAEEGMRKYQLP